MGSIITIMTSSCPFLLFMLVTTIVDSRSLSSSSSIIFRRSSSSFFRRPISEASIQLPVLPVPTTPIPAIPPGIPCDFESFEGGCEDIEGSFCDQSSNKCVCKDDHPIRLLGYCLTEKAIGDDCFTSAQCKRIEASACYIFGKEYDNERTLGGHNVGRVVTNWPTGTCRCNIGFIWDNSTNSCVKRTMGSWCTDDWDCIKDMFNTQCSRPSNLCECSWGYFYDSRSESCVIPKLYGVKCLSTDDCKDEGFVCSPSLSRCVCPTGTHFDHLRPGCKPNDDSSCDVGQKWDNEWSRCVSVRTTNATSATFPNLINRTKTSYSSSSSSESGNSTTTNGSTNDPSSPTDSGSSMSILLMLTVPNIIACLFIVRYCCYRKSEDDLDGSIPSDLRNTHIHNFSKFCAYPATYNVPSGGMVRGGMINASFMGVGCCGGVPKLPAMSLVTNGTKVTLESVEEESKEEDEVAPTSEAKIDGGEVGGAQVAGGEEKGKNDDEESHLHHPHHQHPKNDDDDEKNDKKPEGTTEVTIEKEPEVVVPVVEPEVASGDV